MKFELRPLQEQHIKQFKKDMQEAFQQGAEDELPDTDSDLEILPESHIDHSLNSKGAYAYEAIVDSEIVGGAIVVINEITQHNHLDFLYVKNGVHNKGVGQLIWKELESLFPETKVWETCTPYFDRRNLHFYINKCGFHVTEYFNQYHLDPNDPDRMEDLPEIDYFADFFRFEKYMKTKNEARK